MKKQILLLLSALILLPGLNACTASKSSEISDADFLARLDSAGCSCLVYNKGVITQHSQRGVRDLYELVTTQPEQIRGAHVADKIIGKGAAALLVKGEVRRVATHTITTPALKMLRNANIKIFFENEVPYVENRKKTGQCPLDARLQNIDDANACLPIIHRFIEDLDKGVIQ